METALTEENLAPVAKEFLAGNRTQALAILVGVTTTVLTASPILGGAAAGLIPVLAKLLANSAMKRAKAAAQELDSERAFVEMLQNAVSTSMKEDFAVLWETIEDLRSQISEQFVQTLKFTERNVADPLAEVHRMVGEIRGFLAQTEQDASGAVFEGPGRVPACRTPHFQTTGDLQRLDRLLTDDQGAACVVVLGMGGVGKTVLVQQYVATNCRDTFPDGATWIDGKELARDLAILARRFGWTRNDDPTTQQAVQHLGRELGNRPVLVVVDNIDASFDPSELPVPGGCTRTVVTSRDTRVADHLGVSASILALDHWDVDQCASLVREVVAPRELEEDDLHSLCSYVGGLPLAVRLLALHLRRRRDLSCRDVLQRLQATPLDTLDRYAVAGSLGSSRGVVATFAEAYEDLQGVEKRLLGTLAVCAMGTQADIVAAVSGVDPEVSSEGLNALCDASWVHFADGATAPWSLHDVLRHFVSAQPGVQEMGEAHAAWVDDRCLQHWVTGDYEAFERIVEEAVAATRRRLRRDRSRDAEPVLSLLVLHMQRRGQLARALSLLQEVLAAVDPSCATAGSSWGNMGLCLQGLGETTRAIECHETALSINEALGEERNVAANHSSLGNCLRTLGRFQDANEHYRRALDIETRLDETEGMVGALNNLASLHKDMGDIPEAVALYKQALRLGGDQPGRDHAAALTNLGVCLHQLGQSNQGLECCRGALVLFRTEDDAMGEVSCLNHLGSMLSSIGELDEAAGCHEEALDLSQQMPWVGGRASSLGGLGVCHKRQGNTAAAIECYSEALRLHETEGRVQGQITNLRNLSACYAELGQVDAAKEAATRGVALCRDMGMRDDEEALLELLRHLQEGHE